MHRLPENPNLDHLKKQAKDLLRLYTSGDPSAFVRFRNNLPAAEKKSDAEIVALGLKLHDAQSCIAREYNFPTWATLKDYVMWRSGKWSGDAAIPIWLNFVYGHDYDHPRPLLAARMLEEAPHLAEGDLMLACAAGDERAMGRAIDADAACVNRAIEKWRCPGCGEVRAMPPLVAVTHSALIRVPELRDRFHRCARLLLDAGADPNQSFLSGEHAISALYGAAGANHDPELTRMLLAAGANPNDNESLYHAMETRDLTCARILLEAGSVVENTNALHHQLDYDDIAGLRLLLRYTKDVNNASSSLGSPLLWAIRRGRSRAHIEALLAAGADPNARVHNVSAYKLAMQNGLADAAALLPSEPLTVQEQFIAACACADEKGARRMLRMQPDIIASLSEAQLRQLPNLAAARNNEAVKLMVRLGWPVATRGGDWQASALNLAVFNGDAELARFLLENGSSWTEEHGHGDNVHGTLCWASRNHSPEEGDWVGCAAALVDHGLPIQELSGNYSDEVADFFAGARERHSK